MGRASRGKSERKHALGADNRGNRLRQLWAYNECLSLLAGDLRVQEFFQEWLDVLDHVENDPPDLAVAVGARRTAALFERRAITTLSAALRQMGVPWEWCAHLLVTASFPAMRANLRRTSPDDRVHGVQFDMALVGIPKGQAPPHDGASIEDNVRWWYRAKIKHPPDSVSSLAEEYAKRENRVTDARSVVQIGIQRAETLLRGNTPG